MKASDLKGMALGLSFACPWMLGLLAFTLYPIVSSLLFAFCDYDVLSKPLWTGSANFDEMLRDELFWKTLFNTFVFAAISIPLGLLVSLSVAVMLNAAVECRSTYRVLFYLPSLAPAVATAMIWLWLFNGKFGLLNYILQALFSIDGPNWLQEEAWTKPALALTTVWGVGNAIVIYLAALNEVPRHLYEAAEIDGASPLDKLVHITLPMISPVIYFNLLMGIIGSLQTFAGPYILLPEGGPDRSALLYAVYLFENAFRFGKMGYACALAWVLFIIILALTWLAHRLSKRHVHYGGE